MDGWIGQCMIDRRDFCEVRSRQSCLSSIWSIVGLFYLLSDAGILVPTSLLHWQGSPFASQSRHQDAHPKG